MSAHYTRDYVWVVHTSLSSFDVPYQKLKDLGVNGVYLNAADGLATNAKRVQVVNQGFKCGLFYPGSSAFQFGTAVAQAASKALSNFGSSDLSGQTPILFDFEPSDGSFQFWLDFMSEWRNLRPGRVSDMTPEPFKAGALPLQNILNQRFDVKVQTYFGDMSPVETYEVVDEYLGVFPHEAVRTFVDGGRVIKPPIFYQGKIVRNLRGGTIIWNSNLLRESGLV